MPVSIQRVFFQASVDSFKPAASLFRTACGNAITHYPDLHNWLSAWMLWGKQSGIDAAAASSITVGKNPSTSQQPAGSIGSPKDVKRSKILALAQCMVVWSSTDGRTDCTFQQPWQFQGLERGISLLYHCFIIHGIVFHDDGMFATLQMTSAQSMASIENKLCRLGNCWHSQCLWHA